MQLERPLPSWKSSKRSTMVPPTSAAATTPIAARECSMCGDVGFHKELLHCTSCKQRYQHRYCSSFYPNVAADEKDWSCDWCLFRDKNLLKKSPSPSTPTAKSASSTSPKRRHQDQVPAAKQSALECLLVVAAENLERGFNDPSTPPSSTSLKGGRIRRVMSMPASLKKLPEAHSPAAGRTTDTNSSGNSSPKLHKRKRCGDMERQELRLRPPPPAAAAAAAAKPPFSPSPRGVAARRYRLLSEVLC